MIGALHHSHIWYGWWMRRTTTGAAGSRWTSMSEK
mgnify:CR=1 FL=1